MELTPEIQAQILDLRRRYRKYKGWREYNEWMDDSTYREHTDTGGVLDFLEEMDELMNPNPFLSEDTNSFFETGHGPVGLGLTSRLIPDKTPFLTLT